MTIDEQCPKCKGAGTVIESSPYIMGLAGGDLYSNVEVKCDACGGTGVVAKDETEKAEVQP